MKIKLLLYGIIIFCLIYYMHWGIPILLLLIVAVFFGVLYVLMLYRKINPDKFFLSRTGIILFSHVYIRDYEGGIEIDPDVYTYTSNRFKGSVRTTYYLSDNAYTFHLQGNNFVLTETRSNKSFVIGEVEERKADEYSHISVYKVKLKDGYHATHECAISIIPYYVKPYFTMMSSGGTRYSTEAKTIIATLSGKYLLLYSSSGYIGARERTGIYN